MKKNSNTTITMCEVGIFAAIGYVIDELQGILSKGLFINGGSIGFAMIAVLIIAFRRGWLPAILTGLIMGLLDLATGAYILHPAQLLLDYVLPYALVGLVGFLKPLFDGTDERKSKILWLISGTIIGGMLKFLSHYLAGVIFWANPENFACNLNSMNPYLYCFIYNIAFIGPSIVLTGAILVTVFVNAPRVLNINQQIEEKKEIKQNDLFSYIESVTYIVGGAFCFIYFLIKYILSFGDYQDGSAYGYDFDPDCMLIFVLGFMILVLGVNTLLATMKKKHNLNLSFCALIAILSSSFIYSIARLIRMYKKEKDPTTYWIWFAVGLVTILVATVLYILEKKQLKKMGD